MHGLFGQRPVLRSQLHTTTAVAEHRVRCDGAHARRGRKVLVVTESQRQSSMAPRESRPNDHPDESPTAMLRRFRPKTRRVAVREATEPTTVSIGRAERPTSAEVAGCAARPQ
jgi:hypothetical protein